MSAKPNPNAAAVEQDASALHRVAELPFADFIARLNPSEKDRGKSPPQYDNVRRLTPPDPKKLSFFHEEYGLSDEESRKADKLILEHFLRARLPEAPKRDFIPYNEDLFEYLQSEDGFGPWIKAGALSRPLIRSTAKKAYAALTYYLRTHDSLPGDLNIPTVHELTDQKLATDEVIREARRVAGAATMRKRRTSRQP